MRLLESVLQDIRYALRTMRSSAGLTTVAVLSLALGIGTTIAIFSVMYALMLRSLPVEQPHQLIELTSPDGFDGYSYAEWKEFSQRQDIFSNAFAYNWVDDDLTLGVGGAQLQEILGFYVSGEYFQTLGIKPLFGRMLTVSDNRPGAAPVCVIGYGLWQRHFDGSRSTIGRTILVNGHSFQIVGIVPRSFFGLEVGGKAEIFMPLETERTYDDYRKFSGRPTPKLDDPAATLLIIVGRLKPGTTVTQADARLRILGPQIYKALPPVINDRTGKPFPPGTITARAIPNGISDFVWDMKEPLELLIVMAGALLLIACTNLGNLLLARATRRRAEIATRLTLGATRWRLMRQLMTESLMLAAAGFAGGLLFARWGSTLLVSALSYPDDPRALDLSWDPKIVAFAVGITLLSAVLFGLAPAIRATRVSLYSAMNSGSAGHRRDRLSNAILIVLQVSLSMALFVSAGLLARTLHALLAKNPGYDAKNVLGVEADFENASQDSKRQAFLADQLLQEFRSLPGVLSASRGTSALTSKPPILAVRQPGGSESRFQGYVLFTSSDSFKTKHSPMLSGRDFNTQDTASSLPVAILSEQAAKAFFPRMNAVGLRYEEDDGINGGQKYSVEVVGVVKDIDFRRPSDGPLNIIWRPVSQCRACSSVSDYELRFAGSLSDVRRRVTEAVASIDSRLPLKFSLLSDEVRNVTRRNRMIMLLTVFFSLLAGVLAMIGVYGITSYAASQRTREIGIRMALGAQPASVFRMILSETIIVVFVGVALGVAAGYDAAQALRGMLWGVSSSDPLTFAGAACVMLLIAVLAAFLPARRAAKLDPMISLRCE